MTITEKIEIYGKYFMDVATEEELQEFMDIIDAAYNYDADLAATVAEISCCQG